MPPEAVAVRRVYLTVCHSHWTFKKRMLNAKNTSLSTKLQREVNFKLGVYNPDNCPYMEFIYIVDIRLQDRNMILGDILSYIYFEAKCSERLPFSQNQLVRVDKKIVKMRKKH